MIDRWIVAHDAHVADIAAGRKTFGYDVRHAKYAALRQPIHVGRAGGFQWRFAAENIERIIGHAVALKNDVFHWCKPALESYLCSFSLSADQFVTWRPQIGNHTGSTRI